MLTSFSYFETILKNSQVNFVKLIAKFLRLHKLILLPIRTHNIASLIFKTLSNVRTDESRTTSNADL